MSRAASRTTSYARSDVVVAIGSNIRPDVHVPRALHDLASLLDGLQAAPVQVTAALERPEQPSYWNTAVRGTTRLDASTLKRRLRAIEADHGRRRGADRHAARTLDLDEIWRDGCVQDPDVHDRGFLQDALSALGVQVPSAPTTPRLRAGPPATQGVH